MTENQPLISVVITCKNAVKTIKETIESLKAQTMQDFEVIIVDAFSSDGTYEYLLQEQKVWPKLRVYRCSGNPAKGRNYAISRSRGKYIAFTDADAYATPSWLERLYNHLCRHEEYGVAGVGGPGEVPPNDSLEAKIIGYTLSSKLVALGTRNNSIWKNPRYVDHHPFFNAMFPRWVFEKIGLLNEELDVGEDVEFGWRIRKHGYKLLYVPDAVVYHHRRSSLKALAKQMYRYGYWRAKLRHVSKDLVKPKHYLPLTLLAYTTACTAISLASLAVALPTLLLQILATPLISYMLATTAAATQVAIKLKTHQALPVSLAATLIAHFAYGAGFLRAMTG